MYEPLLIVRSTLADVGVTVMRGVKLPAALNSTMPKNCPRNKCVPVIVSVFNGWNVVVPGRRTPDMAAALANAVVDEL